ncbi:hypothetical protein [Streptomyces sp. NBC_01233]|uniref:hypothetical protein n=1 Tax=Streptomyces sp. NBC_01233 TaxID=2903787 RepID=UPI002E163A8D|nr:hypothetical protein OG332_24175 [Streptomyces sp. NBC_01233]
MGAHLFVVPDPEPDEAPGPGDRPVLVPAPVIGPRTAPDHGAAPAPPIDFPAEPAAPEPADPDEDDDQDHDVTGEEPGEWDVEDQDPQDVEDDAGEYDDEAPARRAMTVPDLRPYVDPRPLRELGPLAVEAGKVAGPPLLRATVRLLRDLGQMLAWYGRGLRVLLVLLAGWLSGKYGKHGSLAARFGVVAFLVYAVAKLSTQYAYAPWIAFAVALAATVMAATGAIEIPPSKPTKKEAGKGKAAKGKGDQAPAKGKTAPAEDSPEDAYEEAGEVSKEAPAEAPRTSWATRLFRRPAPPAETPAETPEGTPDEGEEEAPEESPEDVEEEPQAAPLEDPLTALLRTAIGGENGVHLEDLRPLMRQGLPGLSQATDKELREHLLAAGYDPSRKFRARGVAGRAGVHRTDLPPLPSPEGAPGAAGDHSPPTLHPSRPADSPGSGEQRRGAGEGAERWTAEEMARGFRSVPDPERGPSASRIEHWRG